MSIMLRGMSIEPLKIFFFSFASSKIQILYNRYKRQSFIMLRRFEHLLCKKEEIKIIEEEKKKKHEGKRCHSHASMTLEY